jgi:hypothetical protein
MAIRWGDVSITWLFRALRCWSGVAAGVGLFVGHALPDDWAHVSAVAVRKLYVIWRRPDLR